MALVVVLLVVVVISIMGLSLMGLAANNVKMSSGDRNYQSSYYIAESGVTYEMNQINKNIMSVYNPNMQTFFSAVEGNILNLNNPITLPDGIFENSFGQKPTAVVKITGPNSFDPNSPIRQYTITSTGTINNRFRIVQKSFKITWSPNNGVTTLLNKAVLVNSIIDMYGGNKGGQTIYGSVATNSSAPGSIIFGGDAKITNLDGTTSITVGPNAGTDVIKNNINNYPTSKMPSTNIITPIFPQTFPSGTDMGSINYNGGAYTLNMDKDMKFSQISLASSSSISINVNGTARNLIVDNLNLTNGFIEIKGGKKLTIYVKDTLTLGTKGSSTINGGIDGQSPGNVDNLEIYYKGASLNLQGSQKIYGSVFAGNINAVITFSGGASMQGHLVSLGSSISFTGGSSADFRLLYAPNANVDFSNGAVLKGSVVANSISMSGGSKIYQGTPSIDNLSFFQGSGTGGTASITQQTPVRENN
jgi:hypothetical protein